MKYAYEDLGDKQFETLIVLLCQRLLGASVQAFATGPDGGRDAKFNGTAELHPSTAAPWTGITIIQAKHTNGYNRLFSESDFFSADGATNVIAKELPRVKALRDAKRLDHYMLFANRRLAGDAETDISEHISEKCGVPVSSIYLAGIEQLELFFKRWPNIPIEANLDPVDSPLIVSPDDLAEVVHALSKHRGAVVDTPPQARIFYDSKNKLNNVTPDYAREWRKRYLKETKQIQSFLAAPENAGNLKLYESVTEEFQLKIIAHRKDYQNFDRVMERLVDLLFNRDPILRSHKRLTRAMLFYMYWNCDIGTEGDIGEPATNASTN